MISASKAVKPVQDLKITNVLIVFSGTIKQVINVLNVFKDVCSALTVLIVYNVIKII